jgi:glycosyltransferase involved in cell wall biosynthesis
MEILSSFVVDLRHLVSRRNEGMFWSRFTSLFLETGQVCKRLSRIDYGALRELKLDAVYAMWGRTEGLAAVSVAKAIGINSVHVRHHNNDLYECRNSLSYLPHIRHYSQLSNVNKVFLCQSAKKYAEEQFEAHPSMVVPLGKRIESLGKSRLAKTPSFLSISFESSVKRHDKLLQIISELRRRDVEFKWSHIGPSKLLMSASSNFQELKVLPFLSREEFAAYLNDFEKGALVSVSDYEGLPYSILECLSFGIPALSTDVGCVKDVLGEKAVFSKSASIMEVVDFLLINHANIDFLINEQIDRIKVFAPDNLARILFKSIAGSTSQLT